MNKHKSNKLKTTVVIIEIALLLFVLLPQAFAVESTIRVSVNSSEQQVTDGACYEAVVSGDGRYVVFASWSTNLVASDTNAKADVFLRDTQTNTTTRISVDSAGNQSNNDSSYPSISADGRYIAFYSTATNLVTSDTNAASDIFLRDTQTNTTTRVSVNSSGEQGNSSSYLSSGSVSADGRYVAFNSNSTNLVDNDTNGSSDAFLKDTLTNTITRLSLKSSGEQGNGSSGSPAISGNGRYATFNSSATNLVDGDTNAKNDVFLRDTQTNTTTRISVNSAGDQSNNDSSYPSISSDGRYIAFYSPSTNLVTGDTNGAPDVFFRDSQTNTTTRVSVSSLEEQSNVGSYIYSAISADGRYVVFCSNSNNLVSGDTNGSYDMFLRDTLAGDTTRVNVSSAGAEANFGAFGNVFISDDGRYVVYQSDATNLVSGDTNGILDVFLTATDTTAPTVPGTPSTSTPTTDTTPSWSWTASTDNGSGLHNTEPYTIQWSQDSNFLSGVTSSTSSTNSFTHSVALADETWFFRAKSKDAVNNESTYSSNGSVVVDTTAPITDAGTDNTKNAQYTQNATVTDPTSGVASYAWSKVSGPGTVTFGNENAEDTTISCDQDGEYVIRLTTTDNATNSTYDEISLTWDASAPSIPGTASTTTPSIDKTPTWTWTASDDSTGVGLHATPYTVEWSQDNTFVSGVSTSTSTTNSFTHSLDLADGTWYFRVKAKDILDNSSTYSENGSVLIQSLPPITALTIPRASGYYGYYRSIPTITLSTDIAGTTYYKWDSATNWNLYLSGFPALRGTHTLRYYSTNGISETIKSHVIKVDDYKPRVTGLKRASVRRNRRVRLYYRVNDNYTDKVYVLIKIRKGRRFVKVIRIKWVPRNRLRYYSYLARLSKGKYKYYVYARDRAGNNQYIVRYAYLTIR